MISSFIPFSFSNLLIFLNLLFFWVQGSVFPFIISPTTPIFFDVQFVLFDLLIWILLIKYFHGRYDYSIHLVIDRVIYSVIDSVRRHDFQYSSILLSSYQVYQCHQTAVWSSISSCMIQNVYFSCLFWDWIFQDIISLFWLSFQPTESVFSIQIYL